MRTDNEPDTLVLAIGNHLLGDDGVGMHALRALEQRQAALPDVRLLDGGTLGFVLLDDITRAARLVVIDAAELGLPPGTVRAFEGSAMDRFLGRGGRKSVHEVSLADLLGAAHLLGSVPAQRALIAIQVHTIAWSESLSPPVAAALPAVCRLADALIRRWRDHPHHARAPYPDPCA